MQFYPQHFQNLSVEKNENIDFPGFPGFNRSFRCKKRSFPGLPGVLAKKCLFPGFSRFPGFPGICGHPGKALKCHSL